MDVGDLILAFASTYVVSRSTKSTYTKGRAVPGTTTTLTIAASVQPASGRDLLRLPEGRRSIETRVVWTPTPLLVGQQGENNEADIIAIGGGNWEVQHTEPWVDYLSGVTGYRCIVQSVPTTGDG